MPDPLLSLLIGLAVLGATLLVVWPESGLLARWQRMRRASLRILTEDALKTLFKNELKGIATSLQSIAGTLGIPVDRAAQLLAEMEKNELLVCLGDKLDLTASGRSTALHVVRAHRLLERYLADETGYKEAEWHDRAERFEHDLSPQDLDALSARLYHPTHDPHGDPIPSADGIIVPHGGQPLTALPPGQPGRIVHIEDEPELIYAQLVAEGLYPGMEVSILEKNPQRVRFWANGDEHLLAPIVAANISVQPTSAEQPCPQLDCEPLSTLRSGEKGEVLVLTPRLRGAERRRMMDLGILPGTVITAEFANPSGDPVAYRIRGALIALHKDQADLIHVKPLAIETPST
jgi:DtxR family Mn-dependent transcriptional regulator